MNWKEIQINQTETCFLHEGKMLFKEFIQVLKFHEPGLAPVNDESGWYHIDSNGNSIYNERYQRAFGFYFNRAAVVLDSDWFHIDTNGKNLTIKFFSWTGNFQNNVCAVRNEKNEYFHIDNSGNQLYQEKYFYVGDFYDGICSVKDSKGWKHIKINGENLNGKYFLDLGVFHKGFSTAKDECGWFHIDKNGTELYKNRYLLVEPFYNGQSIVTTFENQKQIIDEMGNLILKIS